MSRSIVADRSAKPILYLDIEDTLTERVQGEGEVLRPGAVELLRWAVEHCEPVFLTGLYRAEIDTMLAALLDPHGIDVRKIPDIEWRVHKIDGMRLDVPFFRLDDHVDPEEWEVLTRAGVDWRVIVVDEESDGLVQAFEHLRRLHASGASED